jgi:hypothetical protein
LNVFAFSRAANSGTRTRARKAKRISTRQPSCPMNMNIGNETFTDHSTHR